MKGSTILIVAVVLGAALAFLWYRRKGDVPVQMYGVGGFGHGSPYVTPSVTTPNPAPALVRPDPIMHIAIDPLAPADMPHPLYKAS